MLRCSLAVLVLIHILISTAKAQDTISFPFVIKAVGSGWGIVGDQASTASAGSFIVSGNGAQTLIPVSFIGIHGTLKETTIDIILSDPTGDVLYFSDSNPTLLSSPGRTGTAKLKPSIGLFHDATGSIQYSFSCTVQCGHLGGLLAGAFLFDFQATGQFTLPANVARSALPSVTPPPPATGISRYINGILTKIGGTPPDPTGNAIPERHATAPAVSGNDSGVLESISISPPWQLVQTDYNASATCANLPTNCWLSIPEPKGTIAPFTTASIKAVINESNLAPGVYPAKIAIDPIDNVPAMLIVNNAPTLDVSESSIQLQAVAGSTAILTHGISVASSAIISYSVTASSLKGSWLSIPSASGSASTNPSQITISANPSGLSAGSYFGRVI